MKKATFVSYLIAINVLTFTAGYLFYMDYIFSSLLFVSGTVALSTNFYFRQAKIVDNMLALIESIKNNSFTIRFSKKKSIENELNQEMNLALTLFKERMRKSTMLETETQTWQKLIKILRHEMMNSLTPIISLSETLLERSHNMKDLDEETLRKSLEIIHSRSLGIARFTDNYKKLTQIPKPVISVIDVKMFMNNIAHLFKNELPQLACTTPIGVAKIYNDHTLLEQILINLIRNAAEAVSEEKESSKITLRLERVGQNIEITVEDNGKGIHSSAMEQVFTPFYTTKQNGNGIGLSLCKQIAESMNGTLTLSSVYGKGTRATLSFPV